MSVSAAIGSVFGSVLGAAGSYFGAKRQAKSNLEIARRQMDFQREMSSTAYQRSMADMKKAGLNPMLAYKQGGASTPSGAGIPAVNPLESAVQSAAMLRRQNVELDQMRATTRLQGQQAKTQQMQELLFKNQARKADYEGSSALQKAKTDVVIQEYLRAWALTPGGKLVIQGGQMGEAAPSIGKFIFGRGRK